jgi:hypothetical protein
MGILPANRVVDVTLTRLDRFATRRGFGVPLILTSDVDSSSPVDASTRTKVYGSMEEVASDWSDTSEAYAAAQAMFAQNPRPLQVKIGFVDPGTLATTPSPTITAELDAVYDYDRGWYWLTLTSEFRDLDLLDDVMDWVETKPILFIMDSNDVGTEDPANTTAVAPRNKNRVTRTAIFYGREADEYPAAALIAVASRFNFDQRDSAYTAKFKRLNIITLANITSAIDQAATGFIPAIGLDATAGHFANVYVNQGGLGMVKEGTMLDGGFIDEVHFSDWLIARTEEELLSTLANSQRVPYTNKGIQQLVAAVEGVLNRAFIAGAVAEIDDPETGDILPAYEINVERVEDVPASQRRQRIAPVIDARFRYAGAVHYAACRYTLTF